MARVNATQTTYVNGVKVGKEIEIEDNTDNPWLEDECEDFTAEDEAFMDAASEKLRKELFGGKSMQIKKAELAKRLGLRYATLLEWEKNRPLVYERLVLSYEYERVIEEFMGSFEGMKKRVEALHVKTSTPIKA